MKEVRDVRVTIDALAGRLGIEPSRAYVEFLLRRARCGDVRLEDDALVHPSFVPVELMLAQTLEDLKASGARVEPCLRCGARFDAEHDEGIFADPARLEGFVCRPCAETMDAWTYFHDVLVSR